MIKILQLCFLSITISSFSQEFKPYQVKSGKIEYQKIRYSTRSVFKSENGVETSFSEQIPYIAEQVIYYWDEFGDIAFEEIHQVSKFGGKRLPNKVKIAERLWLDEHRYYFNVEENKISDDPYYLRLKCKENFQYYQIKGSWVETLYMGTEKYGTSEILDKEADYYKIDKYQDLFVWKGLVLKDESFTTTKKGKRLYPDRTRIAIAIDTTSIIKKELFNPTWLKREKLYNSFDDYKIGGIIDTRQDLLEQADNIEGIRIQRNDIILFVTKSNYLGKMQVLSIDESNKLSIKYSIYYFEKEVVINNMFEIKNNSLIDLDNSSVKTNEVSELDFRWENGKKANLFPLNNKSFLLLKASRTSSLKLKPYVRN